MHAEKDTSAALKNWLQQQALSIKPQINAMTSICGLNLSNDQKEQLSLLMVLEYLSEAVRGLYYYRKQAPLTFYRQLAIKSLNTR